MYFHINQQILIYIRSEREIKKNKVVKTIEIEFTLLGKKKELVSFVLTSFASNKIGKNIIYTILRVNNRIKKNYQVKTNV